MWLNFGVSSSFSVRISLRNNEPGVSFLGGGGGKCSAHSTTCFIAENFSNKTSGEFLPLVLLLKFSAIKRVVKFWGLVFFFSKDFFEGSPFFLGGGGEIMSQGSRSWGGKMFSSFHHVFYC